MHSLCLYKLPLFAIQLHTEWMGMDGILAESHSTATGAKVTLQTTLRSSCDFQCVVRLGALPKYPKTYTKSNPNEMFLNLS